MRRLALAIGALGVLLWDTAAAEPAWRTAPLPPEAERLNRTADAAASLDTAMRLYARSLRVCPTNGPALHGFGLALLEQGRAADARNVFERMEALFPGDPTIHVLLAHAAARLPDPRRADIRRGLESARFAVETDPGSAEAWHALSLLRYLDGDYAAALEAARQSLARDARQPAGPETTKRYQQQETACHDALLVFSPLD